MKKSSLLTKIMISLVLVALVFALVACGKKDEGKKPTPPTPAVDKTLAEQVVEIIQGVNPVLKVFNDTKADGTLGADLSLSVKYDISGNSNDFALAVKANASVTDPAAQISFKQKNQEWVNLTINEGKVYLVQPLTAVNTSNKTDGIQADIKALAPAVTDIMSMAMDFIEGKEISLPEDLATSIGEMLSGTFENVAKLIKIETLTSGYKIVLGSEIMDALQSLLPLVLKGTIANIVGDSMATKIMDKIVSFLAQKPELSIEVGLKNKAISGLAIGYKLVTETGTDTASLNLDFSLSNERVSITNPTVGNKALNIGAVAELAQKNLKAEAEVYGVADFSEDMKNLVFATAKINGAESKGYFNGQTVYFDTNAVYAGLGQPAPDNTKYNVTIGNIDKETCAKTNSSVVRMINEAAAKAKTDYFNKKGASNASYADDADKKPSKNLNQTVYEMLGGKLVLKKDGKSYEDVSEKDVMTKLNGLIGNYIRFDLDTTSSKDNYFNTLKNILTLFGKNDQWIIGYDLIKGEGATVDLSGLTKMDELMSFDKWINMEAGKVKVPANMNGVYGIFNWDTENYNGGVILSKAGVQNDLLDAINVFVTPGKNEDGTYKDVDADFLAEFADYYVAALGYFLEEFDSVKTQEIDAIDMKYAYAKFQYEMKKIDSNLDEAGKKAAKDAFDAAKKEHKDALKVYYTSAVANKVFTKILGVSFENNERSYVAQLIEGGLYLHLGSVKNAGINGYIEIKDSLEGTKSYAFVSGHINVVENDVNAKIAEWGINTADFATDLFTPAKVDETDEDAAYYAKIATVGDTNVKQVTKNVENDTETYEYTVLKIDGKTQYKDRYTALEDLFESLGGAIMSYFGIN
jgi:hypothetical protein